MRMAQAHIQGSPCPLLPPGRMSWPQGALLLLWLFSPPLRAGGGGVAVTSAAGGGSPPATSCPAACSCSNQASRVICTRRELAEVPASIPVNTRYLNLQENSIQVSTPPSLVGPWVKAQRVQASAPLLIPLILEFLVSAHRFSRPRPAHLCDVFPCRLCTFSWGACHTPTPQDRVP